MLTTALRLALEIVARGLGVDLPLSTAVAAYYRSLFLNVTLPGGVAGDVHRGISHGRDTSDVGRGLRAVAWERSAGQVVQVVLTVAVLSSCRRPAGGRAARRARARRGGSGPRAGGARAACRRPVPVGTAAQRRGPRPARGAARPAGVAGHRVRVGARRCGPRGHVPDRRAERGATAPPSEMLPLALLVMQAAALPNVGGWGPREGVTAWAFAAAGLGPSLGVATAVVYGVMVFVASLPGAVVLVAAWVAAPGPHRGGAAAGRLGIPARRRSPDV